MLPRAWAQCSVSAGDVTLKSTLASAGTWANLRKTPESLAVQSRELLQFALDNEKTAVAPSSGDSCSGQACSVDGQKPKIVFLTIPNKIRGDNYSDKSLCTKLESATRQKPLQFGERVYATLDELVSWFSEFSQGKGDDGKQLYKDCPGDCSPEYTVVVTKNSENYRVSTTVVCGYARDKTDDQYKLSVAYRWECR